MRTSWSLLKRAEPEIVILDIKLGQNLSGLDPAPGHPRQGAQPARDTEHGLRQLPARPQVHRPRTTTWSSPWTSATSRTRSIPLWRRPGPPDPHPLFPCSAGWFVASAKAHMLESSITEYALQISIIALPLLVALTFHEGCARHGGVSPRRPHGQADGTADAESAEAPRPAGHVDLLHRPRGLGQARAREPALLQEPAQGHAARGRGPVPPPTSRWPWALPRSTTSSAPSRFPAGTACSSTSSTPRC